MKLKTNNLENKLLLKIFRQFMLKIIAVIVVLPLMTFLIIKTIENMNFQWLYNVSPTLYYEMINLFDTIVNSGMALLVMFLILIIGCAVLSYNLLKQMFSYINEIATASKKLLDKDVEFIRLSPELEDIGVQMNYFKNVAERNERLARESEQKKNDLIVYLAHDLKTPLTSVIGYLELLKESPDLPIEQRIKYTCITLDKAYRLEELMNEFFEIARFNDINIVLMKKKLNLKLMLEQLIDEFFPIINEQKKKIVINCDKNIYCYADPDKLSRVFNNVIKNAISYSFENTDIQINCTCENEMISVFIQNKGYTIPENKLNSIFEKFYRLDEARNTGNGGAGLGLAIAKEIIELHGGTIKAKSSDNLTTFMIELPQNMK